ncbi:MAG TPA: hypothetical protein VMD09_00450 [Solirubrobacteraceae bacterium]|nr:hypothetical protein [Solirubrobacteraceae bacterium]
MFGAAAVPLLGDGIVPVAQLPLADPASAIGVSGVLYLCGGLELAATGALLLVKDVRRLGPRPEMAEELEETRIRSSAAAG